MHTPADPASLDPTSLLSLALQQENAYLAVLERLVRHESPTHDKQAADALADVLEALLAADGLEVERVARDEVGDHLIARTPAAAAGGATVNGTLLLAHYDTVWPLGTLEQMPYRRDGNKVYGPGTLDMKAGITTAIFALRIAAAARLPLRGPVTLLITSDEETGSLHSRELIEQLAPEHDRVLVLEPGRDDGALKVGRKGTGGFTALFHGRSAHAGNDPAKGASALRELAHFLFYSEALGDDDAGTTVNLTVARGGTVTNVIAEEAEAKLDMRVLTAAEGERVESAIYGYAPHDDRVRVEISGGLNRPPLEATPANAALWHQAQQLMSALGLAYDGAIVGGGSDGNFTSALGIATLDGLGSVGAGPHARHEHIRVRETLERVALVTGLLLEPAALAGGPTGGA